jgi:GH25 family lysozyme M1 (1,4-beta-N-acetylmuramidase)
LRLDWEQLKAGGVEFVILKASQGSSQRDPRFEQHLHGAHSAGLICAAYHWCDPTHDDGRQAENFLAAIAGKPVAFAAVDVEQYWQDWGEWSYKRVARLIPPGRISQSAQAVAAQINARSGLPTLIYTRASFVREYALPMSAWLPKWDLWLAHYPYGGGRVTCDWEQLRQHFPRVSGPTLPEGCRAWRFWQFSAEKFILPGAHSPLDLNFFNGDRSELRAWCRLAPPASPDPPTVLPPEEMLARLWRAHPEIHPKTEEPKHD